MKQADREVAARTITALLRLAKLDTMRGIYARLAPGPDGRIRSVLSVVGTETGRLSSSGSFLEASTNLQNMPKRTALGDALFDARRVLVPGEGKAFLEADLKQAEAIATAAYSADDALLDRMAAGEDIHVWTSAHIFGKEPAAVTKRERFVGKVARHALNYGMGWRTFMDNVNADADLTGVTVDASESKRIVDAYHDLHPRLHLWWDEIERQVTRQGYLRNAFGRRRDFFGRRRSDNTPDHGTLKEAIAFLPQSTIADLLNDRLVALFERESAAGFRLLLQIHDAILMEVPRERLRAAIAIVKNVMETTITINERAVRVPVEIAVSEQSWGELEEVAA